MRAEIVRRPDEWTVYRAPPAPIDIPTPVLENVSRTPGASFIDLRIRKPIAREASWVVPRLAAARSEE